ncbi:MAG: hypothetical protein WC966_09090 [Bradymonadales bacterium]|jgi:hypothetical protein
MRQRSDLRVVTAPNDAVDDEDAQNGKEKIGASALRRRLQHKENPWPI